MSKRRVPLIPCKVQDNAFVPLAPDWAMSAFGLEEGELVFVKIDRERHWPGHQAFMAFVREAYHSLPDTERGEYKNEDVFRYRLLIAAGHKTTQAFVCKDEEDAIRIAGIIRSMTPPSEMDYRVMSIQGTTMDPEHKQILVIETARSQAMKEMDEETFFQSVNDVEDVLAIKFGRTRETIAAWKKEMSN